MRARRAKGTIRNRGKGLIVVNLEGKRRLTSRLEMAAAVVMLGAILIAALTPSQEGRPEDDSQVSGRASATEARREYPDRTGNAGAARLVAAEADREMTGGGRERE